MKKIVSAVLVIMMLMALTVSVSALSSPGTKDYYKIEVDSEGKGHATKSTDKVEVDSDETVTLTAVEDGGTFREWKIDGEYELEEGDLKSKVLVIRPKSDFYACAYFDEEGVQPTDQPTEKPTTVPDKKPDGGNTSPKTGYPMFLVFAAMGLAMIAGVTAVKKMKG